MFTIGAFAIILDEQDRVLLSHRRDLDVWNLPGGGVESGELPNEAVLREVWEETGLEVEIERLAGIYGKTDKDELVFSFVCRVTGGELALTDESSENRYFEITSIPYNTNPKQVERIHDTLDPAALTVFRNQSGPSTREMLKQWQTKSKRE
jgi:8-oxo-dGTP diphosphatase